MGTSTTEKFSQWLNAKLREFNTDESVFGSYITGILEGDESIEEKTEALEGILAEIIESDTNSFIKEILDKWKTSNPIDDQEQDSAKQKLDVDEQLVRLLESQKLVTKVEREYTEEERRIKQQILSQYSQLSESEHEDDDEETGGGGGGSSGTAGATSGTANSGGGGGGGGGSSNGALMRNTNASDVAALVREKREQAKLESQQKKEKDKQDREKQKQLREEKKEKRKTVKGERRR
ncbi:coiled-coil domain-containing protein 43 [Uranotaenia lowii]|uniref:coiled-coil domain-containing protein 43 n=1 Tax=Uranotaenia lowii TaxID=190385 RepID=UPI00247A94E8|nr:coiled-coil domain-containing protein 43 [Uranotaenia lowii]